LIILISNNNLYKNFVIGWCKAILYNHRTDLKVEGGSLEIPSVLSKYIRDDGVADTTSIDDTTVAANAATANSATANGTTPTDNAPKIPGNVVFDYLPLHPALSNPKSNHRYQLSLWKQPSSLKIDKSLWSLQSEKDRKASKSLAPHSRLYESQSEIDLEIRSRSIFLPTLAFTKKHNLTLSGLYLFTSTFNIQVPGIYAKLGLHQPVFGNFRPLHARHTLRKIDASTDLAKKGLKNLDSLDLKKLNHGYKTTLAQPHLPTRRDLRVTRPEVEVYKPSLRKENGKVKRLGVYGAVGLVRSFEGDVACGFEGVVRRKFGSGGGYIDA
jgi:hypothetical protein